MGNCLNILERPEVFIPTAALIVIVLLVWAQLSARGDPDRDFNLVLGFVWTYLAILFALVAVALFVYDNTSQFAKGFLVLSFLMTVSNVILALIIIMIKLISGRSFSRPLTVVRTCSAKFGWILVWLAAAVGLGILSIGYALECSYWWIGILLFGIVVVVGGCKIVTALGGCHHLYNQISWCLWRKRVYVKRAKQELEKHSRKQ